jgi:hypothetical protein
MVHEQLKDGVVEGYMLQLGCHGEVRMRCTYCSQEFLRSHGQVFDKFHKYGHRRDLLLDAGVIHERSEIDFSKISERQ